MYYSYTLDKLFMKNIILIKNKLKVKTNKLIAKYQIDLLITSLVPNSY